MPHIPQKSRIKANDNTVRPDGSAESTSTTYESALLTELTFDSQRVLFVALLAAHDAIINGLIVEHEQGGTLTMLAASNSPAAGGSHRELAWLVQFHQSTTPFHRGTRSLGTADDSLLAPNSELMDETSAEFIAYKAAFEAYCLLEGQFVIVDRLLFVGKAL